MTGKVKPIPDGISILTPRLFCRDPEAEIDFLAAVFSAKERGRRPGPDGTVSHALLDIGPATLMIESQWPNFPSRPPAPDGSSPVPLYIYVDDVDRTFERAVARGAKVLMPIADQFWGDRMGWIIDPAGHVWAIATRVEETTEEERQARLARTSS